jgi:copper oxidase (laccase) domain-containing protein
VSQHFFQRTHRGRTLVVATFGGRRDPQIAAAIWCKQKNIRLQHEVHPPSHYTAAGFREITIPGGAYTQYMDGIEVHPGHAVGIRSKDCPIVTLHDQHTGCTVTMHAGRPALTPKLYTGCAHNTVIAAGLHHLTERGATPRSISAYITAGICLNCFRHDRPGAYELVVPFAERHPHSVSRQTGGLDLTAFITAELVTYGLMDSAIHHDTHCTYEEENLASYRRGDKISNLTVVAYC